MIVDCAIYEAGHRRDGKVELEHAYDVHEEKDTFVWIGLYEPTEDEFDALAREFNLHPLAVEDAIHAHQRPKLEVFGEMVLLVLKTARYVDPTEVIELGELLIFLGHDYVITVRHGTASGLGPVRESLESDPERLSKGPGAVLHAILDRVVDDYGPAIDGLQEDIDQVEDGALLGQPVRESGRADLPAAARGARVQARERARWSTRSRSSPRVTSSRWTRRSATTSATSTIT